ncbi:MAG TPA: phage terminase large subunit, partial [Propionibacteriaceae bacterium]|nr:phage terminase large subunit [Propionibacteriaceae bacterium]
MTAVATEHSYWPRGASKALFDGPHGKAPQVVLSGPAGTGKSRACLEKLHLMCLANPGMRGLMVRKTQISLTSTALVTFREHVARESLASGDCVWYSGSPQESAQYRYRNGSLIVVGGMDKATRIMSSEYDVIYVQEAIELTENDWEALSTRLRHGKVSFQQLLADTNPDVPTHWLKQRANSGRTVMLESRHEDNPIYFDDEGRLTHSGSAYMDVLDNLTGPRKARLRDGLWVAAEGIIYEAWDPATHLLDRFDIPADWPRYWAVDFGYTNPFVLQRWALDPDGRLYLYAEQYRTRRLVEDHAADVRPVLEQEPAPVAIVCDHDAEDRATLERHLGLHTVPAKKTVSDGIQAVQSRLKVAGDGRPRL